jgi:D-threonate/D-erythronate kinase
MVGDACRRNRLALLADDLTGACDAGVQFSQLGISTSVLLDEQVAQSGGTELLIRSSDSRTDSPDVASKKVERLMRFVHEEKRRLIFKKIDSTLRGNLGIEILTTMTHLETSIAVLAPAFPAMGRTLVAGWLRERGSARGAAVHLPTLVRYQGIRNVVHLGRPLLQQGLQSLIQRFRQISAQERQVVVCDASIQDDLSLIARAAANLEPHPLVIGSAGLANEVAKILAARRSGDDPAECKSSKPLSPARPAVLFIGSENPVTAAQIDHLLSSRPSTRVFLRDCSTKAGQRAIENGIHLVIIVGGTMDSGRAVEFTSRICELPCAGFILSGGDTAQCICKALDVKAIRLVCEVAPGIPWGKILGGLAAGLPVVTKAGGFGRIDALTKAADFLATCERSQNEN